MKALLIALQFLSRLPVRVDDYETGDIQRSIYWYTVVGLLLGLVLSLLTGFLISTLQLPASITAALVLIAWVIITGGLHLDGLADSADAWLGGHDRNKAFAIMKDPRSGPAAIAAIALILLLKYACLAELLSSSAFNPALIISLLIARALIPLLFALTPYVGNQGLGQPFSQGLNLSTIRLQLVIAAVICVLLAGVGTTLNILLLNGLTFYALRRLMIRRIGGTTGDTAGGMIECLETVTLLALCL